MSEDVSTEGKSKLPPKVEIIEDLFEAIQENDVTKATEILDSNDIDANFTDQVSPCHFVAPAFRKVTSFSQFFPIFDSLNMFSCLYEVLILECACKSTGGLLGSNIADASSLR